MWGEGGVGRGRCGGEGGVMRGRRMCAWGGGGGEGYTMHCPRTVVNLAKRTLD